VDTSVRPDVVGFFRDVYEPALLPTAGWTGSVAGCNPGTIDPGYRDATIQMVNYFRAMAGLPGNVVYDAALDAKCQAAALMFAANGALSHNPPMSWTCYSADGAEAAQKSNIALGIHGAAAVALYMSDSDAFNTAVGHRRWILFPPQVTMGTGAAGPGGGATPADALWVLGPFGSRPPGPEFIVWPPAGYVPYQVVSPRWSFSIPGADFSGAAVAVSEDGAPMAGITQWPHVANFGDNTLVWDVAGGSWGEGLGDTVYHVEITNVVVGGNVRAFSYEVTIIDPALVPVSPQSDGMRLF
jgi:hypothetical protein